MPHQKETGKGQSSGDTRTCFHEGSSFKDGLHTKPVKLEFPHFDGEDPETWSCRAEQFFDYLRHQTDRSSRLYLSTWKVKPSSGFKN